MSTNHNIPIIPRAVLAYYSLLCKHSLCPKNMKPQDAQVLMPKTNCKSRISIAFYYHHFNMGMEKE